MSNNSVAGFVAKIFERSGTNKRGPWTAYSAKITDPATGEELPKFYQFGFDKPGFVEGDYITFQSEARDEKADTVIKGTVRKPKDAPVMDKPAAAKAKQPGNKSTKATASDLFGEIGGYNTEDDIKRITMANARGDAIKTIALLVEADGLPMSGASTKAGQAARYDALVAAVNKLTVQFFNDQASMRLLDNVDDAGAVKTVAKNDLPDQDEEPANEAPAEDELPPMEDDDDIIG